MVLLMVNDKAMVLHWFCVGLNETSFVLCFILVLFRGQLKPLVLQWFCSGVNEKNNGLILLLLRGQRKSYGLTMV